VLQVLAFVEGDPPPTVNATLEVVPPFGAQTRYDRPSHPAAGAWSSKPRRPLLRPRRLSTGDAPLSSTVAREFIWPQ